MESNLPTLTISSPASAQSTGNGAPGDSPVPILEFRKVSFSYPDGKQVLHNNSFRMQRGRTYALVGPTGGGKTTAASSSRAL